MQHRLLATVHNLIEELATSDQLLRTHGAAGERGGDERRHVLSEQVNESAHNGTGGLAWAGSGGPAARGACAMDWAGAARTDPCSGHAEAVGDRLP